MYNWKATKTKKHKVADTPKLVVCGVQGIYVESTVQQNERKQHNMNKLNVKIKSYEATLVDNTAKKVVEVATANGAAVSGPVPLPTKKEIFTILRSVHVNKTSREQFELRTHKRLVVLTNVNDKLVDALKRLELPAGVEVEVIAK